MQEIHNWLNSLTTLQFIGVTVLFFLAISIVSTYIAGALRRRHPKEGRREWP